ncbi:hypothetical protein MIR68_010534 [Amoeboaphelidium protococcarum]|nr:hypothetical protein MIR68_010534 [Amoeboaphelidium protococcarum]
MQLSQDSDFEELHCEDLEDRASISSLPRDEQRGNKNHDQEQDDNDDKTCRICFGGSDDIPTLGRFLSPCKCKGSMKYVHLECLQQWRATSPNAYYYKCPQCQYNYRLSRINAFKLLTHELTFTIITLIIFFIIVILAGFVSKWFMSLLLSAFIDADVQTTILKEDGDRVQEKQTLAIRLGDDSADQLMLDTNSWTYHLISGTTLIGLLSFAGIGIIGNFNFRLGGNNFGGNVDRSASLIILIVVVLIGVLRSFWFIYRNVKRRVKAYGIFAMEQAVLDVPEDVD